MAFGEAPGPALSKIVQGFVLIFGVVGRQLMKLVGIRTTAVSRETRKERFT